MENLFVTLFSLAIILYSWSEAAPSHYIDERQLDQADGPDDDRWRLVSGLETAYLYTQKLVNKLQYCLYIINDNYLYYHVHCIIMSQYFVYRVNKSVHVIMNH